MELYARYEALTGDAVLEMTGEVEDRQLDCKTLRDEQFKSNDDKRNFGTSLSGFANAEGGIILWGVSARKNSEGIDAIESHPGLRDAPKVLARLQELTAQATSPGVVGVSHKILTTTKDALAFISTYVPTSDSAPHMAKLGEDRYYLRIGSSTLRMEHFQVADVFGRRASPKVEMTVRQDSTGSLIIELRNQGRGIARAPFVLLKVRTPYLVAPYPASGKVEDFPLPRIPGRGGSQSAWTGFVGDMNHVIHPGLSVAFTAIQLPSLFTGNPPTQVHAEYRIGAVGSKLQEGKFRFDFEKGYLEQSGDGFFRN